MRSEVGTDILIVGAGIIGLSLAREIKERVGGAGIILIDKEPGLGLHASGRNSGVLHAGFYYTPESMKARLTAEGNRLMSEYCLDNGLSFERCGKVVVTTCEDGIATLTELKERGDRNGVRLDLVDEKELADIEPNASTIERALFSPATAAFDPAEVVGHIAAGITEGGGVRICTGERLIARRGSGCVETETMRIEYSHLINSAGLYADRVAHMFGAGLGYTVIPFKGLYMECRDRDLIGMHVYPVPDLSNPFLGVHFTKAVDGTVRVGPTAMPALWRENYGGTANFHLDELLEILGYEARLFLSNSFNFRGHAIEEMKKYYGGHMIEIASRLVKRIDPGCFGGYMRPGIRAQLLDTQSMRLVMDFVVEEGEMSTHILNAVSPAFTCAFSFAGMVVDGLEERGVL